MDNVSVRDSREFLNLSVERPRMHLLDEPTGYISAMGKSNLGHQIRYSAERLEAGLSDDGKPHVLQLVCEGDEREPQSWTRSWAYAEKPCAPPPSPPAASTTTTYCAPPAE